MQDLENGHEAMVKEHDSISAALAEMTPKSATVAPAVLRRLARLHARAEGAAMVAQAALNAHQAAQAEIQREISEVCQDEGLHIPAGTDWPVDVDWRTGVITVTPTEAALPS
jgi:hypothetical protein